MPGKFYAPRLASLEDRLAARFDKTDGCWLWRGTRKTGYGSITVNGRGVLAHRLIYERERGPIPAGLTLDHLCRNRGCVNPDHLEPVTLKENLLRGTSPSAMHARKTHCPCGHAYDGTRKNGRVRYCKACNRARANAYWHALPLEVRRERNRRWTESRAVSS